MTHEHILKLIEEVDPNDTAKLDQIDANVWLYITRYPGNFSRLYSYPGTPYSWMLKNSQGDEFLQIGTKYTRSRDALKSIRPAGWFPDVRSMSPIEYVVFNGKEPIDYLPTEKLAELYATIQDIADERSQK